MTSCPTTIFLHSHARSVFPPISANATHYRPDSQDARGESARPSSAHLKWPISHHPSNGVEHRVPAAAWAFLRFLDIAAVACTGVSILLSYASTSKSVCSPCRVGIYRNSSAGARGREAAKTNGPETSRNDRPYVNRDGPARNKARGTGRAPVERKRSNINQLISDRHGAGGAGEGPRGGEQQRETRPRKQAHVKQRSRDADD